jgi:signal transduction histidine kinase
MRARAQLLGRKAAIGTGTPEEMAKGLDGIIFQVDRLTGLLNLLLDFSRIEAGRLEMEHEPTDLVGIAQTVIADVQAATAGAPIHRLVLTAPSSVDVTCDPRRLEQVLQNLVANAVKYSPEGGTVEVRIESNDGTVTVRVRDEGLGLAPEELPLLFDRFYRASGGRSLAGNGLGLYICRAIVAAHGGRIWAESAGPGQGSTFSFTLPAG